MTDYLVLIIRRVKNRILVQIITQYSVRSALENRHGLRDAQLSR